MDTIGTSRQSADWFNGYTRGYRDGAESLLSSIKVVSEEIDDEADEAVEVENFCHCYEDSDDSGPVGPYCAAWIDEKFGFHIEYVADDDTVITGFVICVNDVPYPDTFSEDPSMAWQAFLPILEADPSLGNEDVRLVRLVEE